MSQASRDFHLRFVKISLGLKFQDCLQCNWLDHLNSQAMWPPKRIRKMNPMIDSFASQQVLLRRPTIKVKVNDFMYERSVIKNKHQFLVQLFSGRMFVLPYLIFWASQRLLKVKRLWEKWRSWDWLRWSPLWSVLLWPYVVATHVPPECLLVFPTCDSRIGILGVFRFLKPGSSGIDQKREQSCFFFAAGAFSWFFYRDDDPPVDFLTDSYFFNGKESSVWTAQDMNWSTSCRGRRPFSSLWA